MNEATQASKDTILKSLAVIGFVAAIIFAVWLAVKIVGIIPNAFTSLASIADGVYNNRPQSTLTVATTKSVVNADESFNVSWTELNRPGVYTFSYACTDGVALDVRGADGSIINLDCDTPLNLSGDTLGLDVTVASEKRRFTDIDYTVRFIENGQTEALATQNATFTVVNASIPQNGVAIADDATDENEQPGTVAGESTTDATDDEATDEAPVVETETPAAPVVAPEPTFIETPILEVPVSDPSGFADLEVRFLGVGTMDNNNVFTPSATIDNDRRGSFQFEVRNVGTKTSTDWEFDATLTSGSTFASADQTPLKPNERSVITLGFDAVGDTGTNFFGATVSGGDDINTSNNRFTWAVQVTN